MAIAQAVNYFYIYFYIHIPKKRAYRVFQVFFSAVLLTECTMVVHEARQREFSKG
jgi:hypothetical protein